MKTIAFTNQKGGVGKTTLVRNIAQALAKNGKKVLLVDLDHQANLTISLNVLFAADQYEETNPVHAPYTLIDFALGDMFKNTFFKTVQIDENIDLLPNEIGFAACEFEMQNRYRREDILQNVLRLSNNAYDYCLLDCPPSFGIITVNALTAADHIIVPLQPSEFSFRGLNTILTNIKSIFPVLKPDFFNVVLNNYKSHTVEGRNAIERVKTIGEGVNVFETVIGYAEAFTRMERKHLSIFSSDNEKAKTQIESLTKEVLSL